MESKSDSKILILNPPKSYVPFFSDFPSNVIINETEDCKQVAFIHIFVKTTSELVHFYEIAKLSLKKDGVLWISWPKKASE